MSKQLIGGVHTPVDKPENYSPHTVVSDRTVGLADMVEHIDYSRFPVRGEIRGCFSPNSVFGPLTFPCDDMGTPVPAPLLPTDYEGRKAIPVCTGVLDYFPAALIEVAKVSKAGNDQHNPGEELHWARGKSMNQADTMLRHWMERGSVDTDGVRHTAKAAWRALAELQLELEAAGLAPVARGAK
jgi:hypothetical protein